MKHLIRAIPAFISTILFFARLFSFPAYGPGDTALFSPPLHNGIIGLQSSTYNSDNNQFLFAWLNGVTSEISVVLCGADGNQVSSQEVVGSGSSSSPSVCYNSTNNQYLVTWIGGTIDPSFSILDNAGNTVVGSQSIPNDPNFVINGNVICCYNAVNNQYCLTWTAQNSLTLISAPCFVLLNADGSIAQGVTEIPNVSGQVTSDFTDSFVTYNSHDNHYLFTWIGVEASNSYTVFAIYNAQGNPVVSAAVVPQDPSVNTSGYPIFSCYNSTDNQYFIAWSSLGGLFYSYFAIYNNQGAVVVPATQIVSTMSFLIIPVCSYNVRNNQYFVSWNDGNTQALCSIFDAQGNVISSGVALPLLAGGTPQGVVFNSFAAQSDKFFITWYAPDNISTYFNMFTVPFPITSESLHAASSVVEPGGSTTLTTTFAGGAGPYTATWSDGMVMPGIMASPVGYAVSPAVTTHYSVTINDNYGNSATSNLVTVNVSPLPEPPMHLSGKRQLNRFANYGEYVSQFTWEKSVSPDIVAYKIYRDITLLATLPASATFYRVHNQPKTPTTYSLQAVNALGQLSSVMSITI